MTRILMVGYDPETVDYSDPALPPGMNAEKINAGIAVAVKSCVDRYDCVVVGGGVRLPASQLKVFEAVINAIHRAAPRTAIAFNTTPHDSADAAARWLPGAQK